MWTHPSEGNSVQTVKTYHTAPSSETEAADEKWRELMTNDDKGHIEETIVVYIRTIILFYFTYVIWIFKIHFFRKTIQISTIWMEKLEIESK